MNFNAKIMRLFIFHILIIIANGLFAQEIVGISANYDNSFEEWIIFTADEEVEGILEQRWAMNNDWSQWDYEIDDNRGSITLRWKNDPSQWEVRGYESTVSCQTKWKGDFTEWRITDNNKTLTLRPRWSNDFNEWGIREQSYGNFQIYTNWKNDPRDWTIVDELDEDVSIDLKMALIFIAVFHSLPK